MQQCFSIFREGVSIFLANIEAVTRRPCSSGCHFGIGHERLPTLSDYFNSSCRHCLICFPFNTHYLQENHYFRLKQIYLVKTRNSCLHFSSVAITKKWIMPQNLWGNSYELLRDFGFFSVSVQLFRREFQFIYH